MSPLEQVSTQDLIKLLETVVNQMFNSDASLIKLRVLEEIARRLK